MVNFDSIKTLGDFYSLLHRVEIDDKARRMYKRVFDRERDINVINGTGWDLTEEWLIRNIYLPGKNPLDYLMKGYKAIEIQHRKNQAELYDDWNEDRFKIFEIWVKNKVQDILTDRNKVINENTELSRLSALEIALRYFLLYKAGIEYLTATEVAEKYHPIYGANKDNIRKSVSKIEQRNRDGKSLANKQQFENVSATLTEYPEIQEKILKLIANIS